MSQTVRKRLNMRTVYIKLIKSSGKIGSYGISFTGHAPAGVPEHSHHKGTTTVGEHSRQDTILGQLNKFRSSFTS